MYICICMCVYIYIYIFTNINKQQIMPGGPVAGQRGVRDVFRERLRDMFPAWDLPERLSFSNDFTWTHIIPNNNTSYNIMFQRILSEKEIPSWGSQAGSISQASCPMFVPSIRELSRSSGWWCRKAELWLSFCLRCSNSIFSQNCDEIPVDSGEHPVNFRRNSSEIPSILWQSVQTHKKPTTKT